MQRTREISTKAKAATKKAAATKKPATKKTVKKTTKTKTTIKKSSFEGKKAPAIKLNDENGTSRSLTEFKGQYVLVYFYPKDMTPGCTVEAQIFRDEMKTLKKLKIQVLGISPDDEKSHTKFIEKHDLNFPLLADVDKKVCKAYKVWVKKNMYGREYMGVQRDSFLIDKTGKVIKHYVKVKPKEHTAEVIADVKAL